jgi:hypothetical protein
MIENERIIKVLGGKLAALPQLLADVEEEKVYCYGNDGSRKDLTKEQKERLKETEQEWRETAKVIAVVVDAVPWENYIMVSTYDLEQGTTDYECFAKHQEGTYRFFAKVYGFYKECGAVGLTSDIRKVW